VLLNDPTAVAVAADGSLYIADTGNHRVRHVLLDGTAMTADSVVETVLGDGSASSGGAGAPADAFPVDSPGGLVLDSSGNLFVTSRQTVKVVIAEAGAIAGPADEVQTIYGAAPRSTFPQLATSCLSGIAFEPDSNRDDGLSILDSCQGMWIQLRREQRP
jgi:hypothetical protein